MESKCFGALFGEKFHFKYLLSWSFSQHDCLCQSARSWPSKLPVRPTHWTSTPFSPVDLRWQALEPLGKISRAEGVPNSGSLISLRIPIVIFIFYNNSKIKVYLITFYIQYDNMTIWILKYDAIMPFECPFEAHYPQLMGSPDSAGIGGAGLRRHRGLHVTTLAAAPPANPRNACLCGLSKFISSNVPWWVKCYLLMLCTTSIWSIWAESIVNHGPVIRRAAMYASWHNKETKETASHPAVP